MIFEGLSDKLQGALSKLKSKGKLTEKDVKDAMREVKLALLEADVNFKVVKDFVKKVTTGDLIIAGNNFGCGSSREHAPIAIKASGISLVIAKSFARIFYRNAINIGLAIVECDEAVDGISDGDQVKADLQNGVIYNLTTGASFCVKPFPEFIQKIIENGGLVESIKKGVIV